MGGAGGTDPATCARRALDNGWTPAVRRGDGAAHPLPATVVEPERPGHGGRTVRTPAVPGVRETLGEAPVVRRDDDPAVSAPAVEALAGPGDFRNDQRPSCSARGHVQDSNAAA